MGMLHKLSMKFVDLINIDNKNDVEILSFAAESVFSTLINIIGLILISALFNVTTEMLVYIVFFASLRASVGGRHAKNHILCFVQYLFISMLAIFLSLWVYDKWFIPIVVVVLLGLSCLFVFIFAPMDHPNRPFTEDEFIRFKKRSRMFIACLICVCAVMFLFGLELFASIGATALFINSVTLVRKM